jgi:hypothetical protein
VVAAATLPTVVETNAAVTILEVEAMGIAMSATTHVAASMLATGSMRSAASRVLPTSMTMTTSPPSQLDYTLSYYSRSLSLL